MLLVTKDHPACRKSFIKRLFQRHHHAKRTPVPGDETTKNEGPEHTDFERKVIENEENFEKRKNANGGGPEVGGDTRIE